MEQLLPSAAASDMIKKLAAPHHSSTMVEWTVASELCAARKDAALESAFCVAVARSCVNAAKVGHAHPLRDAECSVRVLAQVLRIMRENKKTRPCAASGCAAVAALCRLGGESGVRVAVARGATELVLDALEAHHSSWAARRRAFGALRQLCKHASGLRRTVLWGGPYIVTALEKKLAELAFRCCAARH